MTERELIIRSLIPDLIETEGVEGRTLHARLMRWDEENVVSDGGGSPYSEVWKRGVFGQSIRRAMNTGRGWPLMYNHKKTGMPVGMVSMIHEREDGPWATAKISRTSLGNDVRELVNDGALGVSVSGVNIRSRRAPRGVIERMEVAVTEISVTPFPLLKGSDEMILRAQQGHEDREDDEDDEDARLSLSPGALAAAQEFMRSLKR